MKVEAAIAELGQKMGVTLQLDDNRACRLVFDGQLSVDIEAPTALPDHLIMSCGVSPDLFPQAREAVLRSLLHANLFGQDTGGGVLALDEARGEVVLQRTLAMAQCDLEDLLGALELMLQTAQGWVDRLQTERGVPLPGRAAPTDALVSMMRI